MIFSNPDAQNNTEKHEPWAVRAFLRKNYRLLLEMMINICSKGIEKIRVLLYNIKEYIFKDLLLIYNECFAQSSERTYRCVCH